MVHNRGILPAIDVLSGNAIIGVSSIFYSQRHAICCLQILLPSSITSDVVANAILLYYNSENVMTFFSDT